MTAINYAAKRCGWADSMSGVAGKRAVSTMRTQVSYPWGTASRFEACERWHGQGLRPWFETKTYYPAKKPLNKWVVEEGKWFYILTLTEARYLAFLWDEELPVNGNRG